MDPTSGSATPHRAESLGNAVDAGAAGKRPLVTIVITTYNHARFLPESIESALAQEGAAIEVLVVDDGSRDEPDRVVARYPGVRIVSQDNQGLPAARNTGIREARGTFVQFLDADDRLLPGAISHNLASFAARPECALAHGSYRSVDANWRPIWQPAEPFRLDEDPFGALLQRGNRIGVPAAAMYRRDCLVAVGGFDTMLKANEDYDIYLRLAQRYPMTSHPAIIAEYRYHGSNMSGNAPLMLTTGVGVLDAQLAAASARPAWMEALRQGKRHMRSHWIRAQLRQVRAALGSRQDVARALSSTGKLARTAPAAFVREIATLAKEALLGRR